MSSPGQKVSSMLLEKSGEITPERMKSLSQSRKRYPVVDVCDGESKVWCCKAPYCIGNWNVRSMNQGKLEVVKQEMARVNINILGISELKWTGRGEFNSDDHYIYYCGQEYLRRNGVTLIVNKNSLKCSTVLCRIRLYFYPPDTSMSKHHFPLAHPPHSFWSC